MIAASSPIQRPGDARLMIVDARGRITHRRREEFTALVQPRDVVVANDAATLPASLSGRHLATGATIELRLAGRRSLDPRHVNRFIAVAFGAGDFRTPTESRPLPPTFARGDSLELGPLHAVIAAVLDHPRLIEVEFDGAPREIWEGLARHGRPIQYSYVGDPLALWDTWTRIASVPVAFEAPSAGFLLDWRAVAALRARDVTFVTLTHAAGISSTGDEDLDAMLPLDEPYYIPASTADALNGARIRGGRVIAIGTTVVRALEHAVDDDGLIRPGRNVATRRIGPRTPLQAVDALVTGQHEPGTSHYELLRAFQDDAVLDSMIAQAEAHQYRTHEFGDSLFITYRGPSRRTRVGVPPSAPSDSLASIAPCP